MRVAVVGSRNFTAIDQMRVALVDLPKDTVIVSGGAKGADTFAASIARDLGLELVEYLPDWDRYGQKAGFLRNRKIVSDVDRLIAFCGPNGLTAGTKHTIMLALEQRVPVVVLFQ